MSRETKPKDKRKAASIKTLQALIEVLLREVADSHPGARFSNPAALETWAHSTAIYVIELLKRKDAPPSTIIENAKRATKRRLERELADLYLQSDYSDLTDTVS